MYKVSVILPIYNVSEYLHECLDSVIKQTLKELEIICVNDGSTDDSLDIINEYAQKDSRIVVITGPNGGYGKAMNKGLDRATGEYVGIVEPDDYIALNMFEDLYNQAKENELDIIKADFYRFERNEHGDMKLHYEWLDSTNTRYGELLCPEKDPSVIRFVMNTWSGIYKREMLENWNIRHNETPGASFQDNGFFFKTTIHAKRMMIVNKPYYRNRRDNPNSSVKNPEKVYCVNVEYDYIKDFLMEDEALWNLFKNMYSWKKYNNYIFTINRIAEQYRYEYIKRMSEEFKRAYKLGDFSQEDFTPLEWTKLNMVMDSPADFYVIYGKGNNGSSASNQNYKNKYERTLKELNEYKNSTTYRFGKLILAFPLAIKRLVKGEKQR